MSKKRKCIECENATRWSVEMKVSDKNIDYAKQCLCAAKRSIVCDITMKTKPIDHEQYCKHFRKKEYEDLCYQECIENLERMIIEYEANKGKINE